MHVILQRGLALAGQARKKLSHNVAVLNVLVALEGVEVVTEMGHQLLVGLAVPEVSEGELRREEERSTCTCTLYTCMYTFLLVNNLQYKRKSRSLQLQLLLG